MQGLRLTEDTCHCGQASPAIPELAHHLRRLTDHVSPGHSVLTGIHTPRNSYFVVVFSQPCLLRRECEHGNSCPCSCIDRLCGSLLCSLQVVQSPRVISSPISFIWWSIPCGRVAVAHRCRERICQACCSCVKEILYETPPSRAREERTTTQSTPNGGSYV